MIDLLQRYVFAHFGYKVVSLALAVGLWWAVSHDPVAEVEVSVPIEFHRIPQNLEISSVNIPEALVRVRGPERVIHNIRPQEVHVEVDLAGVKPGERTFDLTAQQVHLPYQLEVTQVVPGQVRLSFDAGLTREVEVRPRVIGTFVGIRLQRIFAGGSVSLGRRRRGLGRSLCGSGGRGLLGESRDRKCAGHKQCNEAFFHFELPPIGGAFRAPLQHA